VPNRKIYKATQVSGKNGSRNWMAFGIALSRRFPGRQAKSPLPGTALSKPNPPHYLQAWGFRPRDAKTLFRQEMIPLCYASSCLPLLARQGPSLPVLHLFKRFLQAVQRVTVITCMHTWDLEACTGHNEPGFLQTVLSSS
jgi:hypothetical protein